MNNRVDLNPHDLMLLAADHFRTGQFEQAEKMFRALSESDPGDANYLHMIAVSLINQEKYAEAMPFLDRTTGILRGELISVSINRGMCLAEVGNTQEAMAVFDSLLRNDPNNSLIRFGRGLVLMQFNRWDEAIQELDAALARNPDDAKARFARGFCLLVKGDYAQGFQDYEFRKKDKIDEPKVPLWTGAQSLKGKIILVHGEQGLGDNIMFARYLPLMVERGARVLVWTPSVCRPLFWHLDGVTVLSDDKDTWPEFDMWVRFMSLAGCFGTVQETVPPPLELAYDEDVVRFWDNDIGNAEGKGRPLKVGLCWAGSPKSRYDAHRTVPLKALLPLFDLKGVQFYSLQIAIRDSDRELYDQLVASGKLQEVGELNTFADTAHLMKVLDQVVTVDTSVAHLAGTVGVPTMVMLTTFRTYWLWIEKLDHSPWYPSIRLFRQSKDGDWSSVVDRIAIQLNMRAG